MAGVAQAYDALLVVSFGGPEKPEDVDPFLRKVARGRDIPAERLAEVRGYYFGFGGVSPINQSCRDLLIAVERDFAHVGLRLPVYWGNRNWHPLLTDTLRQMTADGVRRAVAFVTAAYSSYPSCRQYLEDIAHARAAAGARAPRVDKLRHYYNHPGFIAALVDHTRAALTDVPPQMRGQARLVFCAHSLPVTMAESSGPSGGAYLAQLREASRLVAEGVGAGQWDLVWQSRSGPAAQPWLEPDVNDHLVALHRQGVRFVVLVPIGFTCDHMEIVYDLDVRTRQTAAELGVELRRAATAATHPAFAAMVRELVLERVSAAQPRAAPPHGPYPDTCPPACCLPVRKGERPSDRRQPGPTA